MCDHKRSIILDDMSGECLDCGIQVPDPFDVNPLGEWTAAILVPFAIVIVIWSLFNGVM